MYRPESPLSGAPASERRAAQTKASPPEAKVKSKYMNFAEALQAMIERLEARRPVGENSEANLSH
jgi:hypothetical protein